MKQILTQILAASLMVSASHGAFAADASQPASPAPTKTPDTSAGVVRFDIERFDVTGNTLLSPTLVEKLVAPFAGKNRDFADVQKALEALEAAYHARGYNVVQVELPEQELNQGVVRLKVVQTRIGKILIEGNRQFSDANVRASLPPLQEGKTPNINQISNALKVANENPARKINLQLESGEKDEEVNAMLKVTEDNVWKFGASSDNTGTRATGKTHLGFSLQHANMFGLDHVGSFQYTTSAEKPSKVRVYGLGYHIPLYGLGDSIDLYGSYSDVDSGTISAGLVNLAVSGKGRVWGVRYNQNLGRSKNYEPKLQYGLDYKAFINGVQFSGQELGNDVTVHPVSVGYTGNWTLNQGEASIGLNLARNIPGGKKGKTADFNAVRIGASANYTILRFSASYARNLAKDWQWRSSLSGQYTSDALIPGEQFGAGGSTSVRGFNEREISNDYGVQLNNELYSPNLCSAIKIFATQCRVLAFYDLAHLQRNKALAGETTSNSLSSTGLGLRLSIDRYWNVQLDYGHVLSGNAGLDKNRMHFRVNLAY
ncbi:MAG: hypothetical protein RL748_3911 [Pseudomonadota bacterium]|jgi:hemolysin activation/secretion protein